MTRSQTGGVGVKGQKGQTKPDIRTNQARKKSREKKPLSQKHQNLFAQKEKREKADSQNHPATWGLPQDGIKKGQGDKPDPKQGKFTRSLFDESNQSFQPRHSLSHSPKRNPKPNLRPHTALLTTCQIPPPGSLPFSCFFFPF